MPTGSEAVPATELKEVLTHELGDLLYAERRILTMLKTMEREAADPELQARLVEHRGETEEQIERLERAFEAIGEKAKAEKCPGIIGLKEEHDSYKREEKPSKPQLAAYRTAIAMSTALGYAECGRLLQESLMEEEAMARFLEKNAVGSLRKLM